VSNTSHYINERCPSLSGSSHVDELDDIDNQPASMITKEFDKPGMRTIGKIIFANC